MESLLPYFLWKCDLTFNSVGYYKDIPLQIQTFTVQWIIDGSSFLVRSYSIMEGNHILISSGDSENSFTAYYIYGQIAWREEWVWISQIWGRDHNNNGKSGRKQYRDGGIDRGELQYVRHQPAGQIRQYRGLQTINDWWTSRLSLLLPSSRTYSFKTLLLCIVLKVCLITNREKVGKFIF